MSTKTSNPRIRVANHGRENWRTEAQDEPGTAWVVTGPPYPTRGEALLHVDYAAWIALGEPMPTATTAPDVKALQERIDQLTAQNAELERKVEQYRRGHAAALVDADRRERRALALLPDCDAHRRELQYLRHCASWYWESMNASDDARMAIVTANLLTARGLRERAGDTVSSADVAAWLEKNADAQKGPLKRRGHPTLADCLRAEGCDHDGLSEQVKADIREALQLG